MLEKEMVLRRVLEESILTARLFQRLLQQLMISLAQLQLLGSSAQYCTCQEHFGDQGYEPHESRLVAFHHSKTDIRCFLDSRH